MVKRVRGTEDILNLQIHNVILKKIKDHLSLYNFSQIETPILEHTELFVRSVGSETDIVSKEMYTFQQESDASICLRPEGTASIIRAYIENAVTHSPWKVYIYGPMFRHERPQKGRWRQFTQISAEIVNAPSIMHDVQLIKMLDSLFSSIFKLDTYILKINFLGCLEDRIEHKKVLASFLMQHTEKICKTCLARKDKNTLRIFDCKNTICQSLYIQAPKIIDFLCQPCKSDYDVLINAFDILSISYIIDHMLVRGLDYYNKTVFEFSSPELGAQNAFCGGGRYLLGKDVGAKNDIPSVGFGIGFGRLTMLIEQHLDKLIQPKPPTLHVIIPLDASCVVLCLLLAQNLIHNHFAAEVLVDHANSSNLFKKANRLGATYALIIGQDEQKIGLVTIKNMLNGTSVSIKQCDVINYLSTVNS